MLTSRDRLAKPILFLSPKIDRERDFRVVHSFSIPHESEWYSLPDQAITQFVIFTRTHFADRLFEPTCTLEHGFGQRNVSRAEIVEAETVIRPLQCFQLFCPPLTRKLGKD